MSDIAASIFAAAWLILCVGAPVAIIVYTWIQDMRND